MNITDFMKIMGWLTLVLAIILAFDYYSDRDIDLPIKEEDWTKDDEKPSTKRSR